MQGIALIFFRASWIFAKKIQIQHKDDIFFHRIRQLICQHAIKFQMRLYQKPLIVIKDIGSV